MYQKNPKCNLGPIARASPLAATTSHIPEM
jgi:hypothetical protein